LAEWFPEKMPISILSAFIFSNWLSFSTASTFVQSIYETNPSIVKLGDGEGWLESRNGPSWLINIYLAWSLWKHNYSMVKIKDHWYCFKENFDKFDCT